MDEDLKALERRLEKRREELVDLQQSPVAAREQELLDEVRPGMVGRMGAMEAQSAQESRARYEDELREIDEKLELIRRGEYRR